MSDKKTNFPSYRKVKEWADQYGRADVPDDRGVHDFMECETRESWQSLRAELMAMVDGRFEEPILDQLVGKKRKVKYGSYVAWAKLMLQWMAMHKG